MRSSSACSAGSPGRRPAARWPCRCRAASRGGRCAPVRDAVRFEHLEQAVDLVLGARDLDDQRLGRDVDDARAEDLGELHDLRARLRPSSSTLIIASSRKTDGCARDVVDAQHVRRACRGSPRCGAAPHSSASTTIVMRETPAVSVWPTVSDSMLKRAAPEQRRDAGQHAGLVLDVAPTKVIHASAPVSTMALGPPDHVVQVGAGRHHRVDRVLLLDPEVDERPCPGAAARSANGRHDVGSRASTRMAVRP